MNAIEQAIVTLLHGSGLEPQQAKLAVYYAIATWKMPKLMMFPILRFCGPLGTGKSSAMALFSPWCCNPIPISGKQISPPALRDELRKARFGTAIIEEAAETSSTKACEQLLGVRCSPATAGMVVKELRHESLPSYRAVNKVR